MVAYARNWESGVVPEFDMPGHTTSWAVGYPELASGPGPFSIERHFGVFNPVMDPTKESTYTFIDQFVGEMATIFPDAYMHIGGDENQWRGVEGGCPGFRHSRANIICTERRRSRRISISGCCQS